MDSVNWVEFGLAGLFAIYSIILAKANTDAMDKLQEQFNARVASIVATQLKIDTSLEKLSEVMIAHDSRVASTMEVMAKFLEANRQVENQSMRKVGQK